METVIIGLPASGKTTIFNALTGRSIPVGDFSTAGRQVHLADVAVPGRVNAGVISQSFWFSTGE